MVDLMNLSDQVDKDFAIARRRAWRRGLRSWFSRRSGGDTLLPFEETRRALGAAGGIRLGRRTVPLSGVVGSVGQHDRFDAAFMPLRKASPERWKRVDRAFRTGVDLQPVSLYSLDGAYFVEDGHNRVSVARFHGVEWIDAEVTEFRRLPRGDRGFRVSWPSIEDHPPGRISMQDHKL
jgi:hypothetical protein